MAKKSKRNSPPPTEDTTEDTTGNYFDTPAPEQRKEIVEQPVLTTPTLQSIRERVSNERGSTARTIAELETWRSEIDATIAFLRGDKQ